ncbi:aminodeoxychorismate synthase component I [Kitasatospora sp. NPDC051853]|uniref:aminodeoxychorismate synthase component I n=1 Tax=Kitasatospora sp. NPDC051853 TaxID=3364058 RepID=UPI0037A4270A
MRTLLVDNYDSFTHNLAHLLAEVNGREPDLIRNDDPGWHPGLLDGYDAVVLSPGPGRPDRPGDFGHCADVLARGRLPVLGVCLGHQGIAWAHGGRVERAPEPVHGRAALVRHDGTGLFAGLPDPLEVIRYHSLAVTALPPELEPTAWTEDGVLMGLRHRHRPLWGVQFHPESVGTEGGHRLLANFRDLAGGRRARLRARPRRPEPRPGPRTPVRRVLARQVATVWDDEAVFDRLFRPEQYAFWLDSSRPGERLGRFSVLGAGSRLATADVWEGTVTVTGPEGRRTVRSGFLDWLEAELAGQRAEAPAGLPFDFALGWVGYLGYELKAETGGERAHRSELPDAALAFAERAVVLDHHERTTHLLALEGPGAEEWLADTAAALAGPAASAGGRGPLAAAPGGKLGPVLLRHDRAAYLALVEECQEQIAAGETYEVCLTNQAELTGESDPWQAYRFLRRASPAPYGAYLALGGTTVLSTSPERFLTVGRDGTVESRPIKGTRPRGATGRQDAELAADLRGNPKDRAENLMIVDLVRNDLGRVAETGSVDARDILRVESYASAHQLVSTVRARLRPGLGAVDAVRAAFPGGSMTGAPKRRTMELIDRLEGGPRGVYSGAIGYFSLNGAMDTSIVIRTAVHTPGLLRYGVGGAVIALSDPAAEYEETAVKAAPLLALAGGAEFPGREAGFPRSTVRTGRAEAPPRHARPPHGRSDTCGSAAGPR